MPNSQPPKDKPQGGGQGSGPSIWLQLAAAFAVFLGAIIGPLLDDRAQALYDPTKFQYLGSADNATLSLARGRYSRRMKSCNSR